MCKNEIIVLLDTLFLTSVHEDETDKSDKDTFLQQFKKNVHNSDIIFSEEVIPLLFENKNTKLITKLNETDNRGRTALMLASKNGHTAVVKILEEAIEKSNKKSITEDGKNQKNSKYKSMSKKRRPSNAK